MSQTSVIWSWTILSKSKSHRSEIISTTWRPEVVFVGSASEHLIELHLESSKTDWLSHVKLLKLNRICSPGALSLPFDPLPYIAKELAKHPVGKPSRHRHEPLESIWFRLVHKPTNKLNPGKSAQILLHPIHPFTRKYH